MDPQQGAPQPDILIGQTVGNYLVTSKLGEGGMGSVYLAEHPTIGKKVALKVLHSEFSTNPEVAQRFFTEAKAVNAIGHPNIVDIVDYGVLQSGPAGRDRLVYFIMEYLSGTTLSQTIRAESPIAPERALMIALQVADALAASHKHGIVHRDLKPDNIILIARGRERDFVKLLDFGIAKLTGSDGVSSHRTRTGLVLGTPAYMSPEQCEGKPNVDHRTDIYALGIVLYEMLVGRVPFIGEGYGEILVQHLAQAPIPPSRYRMMSPHVEAVVMKALEKRPELRYPTMDEFIRAMSDPVGYVEANGGVAGFSQRQLMPSSAPLPPIKLTPAPGTPTGMIMSPVPGSLTPVPTTLGAASGQPGTMHPPARSRTGFLIGGGIVVVAAAVGIAFVVAGKKSGGGETNGSGSSTVVVAPAGSGSTVQMTPTPEPKPEPKPDPKPVPPTPDPNVHLKITSTPEGADIIVNGAPINKKTPDILDIPRGGKPDVRLRLAGYDEYAFPVIAIDKDELVEDAQLKATKKVVVPTPHPPPHNGSGSATHKGSGSKPPGIGLMRPEDM